MQGYTTAFGRSVDGGSTFTAIANLVDIEVFEVARDTYETTLMDNSDSADGYKTFAGSLRDAGEVSLTLQWVPDNAGQQALESDLDTEADRFYRITYPDGTTVDFQGILNSWGQAVPINDRITRTCKFKVSGKPTVTVA